MVSALGDADLDHMCNVDAGGAATSRIGINDGLRGKQDTLEILDGDDAGVGVPDGTTMPTPVREIATWLPALILPSLGDSIWTPATRDDQVSSPTTHNPPGNGAHRAVADDYSIAGRAFEIADDFFEHRLH